MRTDEFELTPFYFLDENKLLDNLKKIDYIYKNSGTKSLLALKCFATWPVFELLSEYMHGTTSSSLFEVKLGKEKFNGETHAYSVAYADHEIDQVIQYSDKIIFNSCSQLKRFSHKINPKKTGLRINPQISYSHFELADPARRYSRLGEHLIENINQVLPLISGIMIHNNCENKDFQAFNNSLSLIEEKYADILSKLDWISLGGGIFFTDKDYPLELFTKRLKQFSDKWQLQVYLEPGEATVNNTASLEVTVLDIVENEKQIVVVDASVEAHMLDLLIYRENAKILPDEGLYSYLVCGKSCLAGDIFGEFNFTKPLNIGDRISFINAAGYPMVKKNWFNGLQMPSIVIKRIDGTIETVRRFDYKDFVNNLG